MMMMAFFALLSAGSPELHVGPGQDIGTLGEALQRVAASRVSPTSSSAVPSAPLTVHIHGAVPPSEMPLVIGPEHSHLSIVGGTVSGGIRIAGAAWKKFAGVDNLWTATTPTGLPSARQLYVDGVRANRTMAWWPAKAKFSVVGASLVSSDSAAAAALLKLAPSEPGSMLEAVFIFSSGKSFKSSNLQSLIQYEKEGFYLKGFDKNSGHIVEVEKRKNKSVSIKLNNTKIVTSKLIKKFPCTPIHNNTFSFASASPDFRRKLLDRSIFIAEDKFSSTWFSYYRTLKHRNALLKDNRISDIYAWNQKLAHEGELLTKYRKNFFDKTLVEFKNLLNILEPKNVFDFLNLTLIPSLTNSISS